ncbi:hypothetical protein [Gracilimonas mengyeensis]|uniref:PepSY-associated TM region n=1 Tax=Gracilimonas mengyeensis TaxID=1302730 RepID=A0A521DD44_9BACT|nr:hypothetical protein [Gracilimonas mengyeensis]SMO69556.1 PepSY-associated TM region [Gracilimonas mengyeensis]
MAKKNRLQYYVRLIHRYLGFFLAGIMAVYAISGTVLIFRNTDFLKVETEIERQLPPNLSENELGDMLRIRGFEAQETKGNLIVFEQGSYNKQSGVARYNVKEFPVILEKMNDLHKAKAGDPLFYLNVFCGLSLLFFVVSSFWMYLPKAKPFKNGLYFALAGLLLTVIMIYI